MKGNISFLVGIIILLSIIIIAILAPILVPSDPNSGNLIMRLKPPVWVEGGSWEHPLGTDTLGRDILSRIIVGSRVSLIIGFAAVIFQGILGTTLGLLAGYFEGVAGKLIMRMVDIQLSIPFLILALALSAVLGPGIINIVIVLGLTGWAMYARVARATTLEQKEQEYIEAARALGQNNKIILTRHILPNIINSIVVTATFQLARMIIAEASLTFLGLGVPPQIPTWGNMIANGRDYVTSAWWLSTFPGLAIMVVVLGINLLGNGLRDILDPKM